MVFDVGLSPADALRAATLHCAQYQREGDVAGAIDIGKRCEVVVLDENPLTDIRATRSIDSVVLNNALLRREARALGLQRLKEFYDAMRITA